MEVIEVKGPENQSEAAREDLRSEQDAAQNLEGKTQEILYKGKAGSCRDSGGDVAAARVRFCRGSQKPKRIGLDDEALGLAGGTVDYSLVLHGFSSYNLM